VLQAIAAKRTNIRTGDEHRQVKHRSSLAEHGGLACQRGSRLLRERAGRKPYPFSDWLAYLYRWRVVPPRPTRQLRTFPRRIKCRCPARRLPLTRKRSLTSTSAHFTYSTRRRRGRREYNSPAVVDAMDAVAAVAAEGARHGPAEAAVAAVADAAAAGGGATAASASIARSSTLSRRNSLVREART